MHVAGIYPHAHYLGKQMAVYADLPDGHREWLIRIDEWDFNWQDDYRYAQLVPTAGRQDRHGIRV